MSTAGAFRYLSGYREEKNDDIRLCVVLELNWYLFQATPTNRIAVPLRGWGSSQNFPRALPSFLNGSQSPGHDQLNSPAILDKLTTLPWDFLINGRKVLVTSIIPHKLTSAMCFIRFRGVHSIGPAMPIPALFTSPHTPEI